MPSNLEQRGWPIWQWSYSPFGGSDPTCAAFCWVDTNVDPFIGTTRQETLDFDVRYPGQVQDVQSGLNFT